MAEARGPGHQDFVDLPLVVRGMVNVQVAVVGGGVGQMVVAIIVADAAGAPAPGLTAEVIVVHRDGL